MRHISIGNLVYTIGFHFTRKTWKRSQKKSRANADPNPTALCLHTLAVQFNSSVTTSMPLSSSLALITVDPNLSAHYGSPFSIPISYVWAYPGSTFHIRQLRLNYSLPHPLVSLNSLYILFLVCCFLRHSLSRLP